ncbi:MAG: hypothetical protein JST12_08625 [Armatimonadetes bacterium]|nr:hypothetical protein [Armatimonadota bacterium]MBS1726364.1 hypothetical protein [Armatimonadota bacterium]
MQTLTRILGIAVLALVAIGCGADKPPYEPGKGVTPPPAPDGAKSTNAMPNPGSEK